MSVSINPLVKLLFVFGIPTLANVGVWFMLCPSTFWQTILTMIVSLVVFVILFVALGWLLSD